MTARLSRRGLLRTLGTSVPAVALASLRTSPLRAATAPVRLIVFFTANGTIPEMFRPQGTGPGFGIVPGGILEPLAAFKAKLNVLWGVHYLAADKGPGAAHQKGAGTCLTGRALLPGSMSGGGGASAGFASGISVDQYIANRIGPVTRFRSLEMGVRVIGSGNRQRLSYLGSDQPLPTESDPAKVFARVFGADGGDPMQAARLLAERRSVLDYVRQDLGTLMTRLPGDERTRLDRHLESLRDLERQLAPPAGTGLVCTPPAPGGKLDPTATPNYPAVGKLQMDLLVAALACDQTRLAHLMWNGSTSQQTFPWLGINDPHHTMSHAPDSDTATRDKLIAINRWYAEQFAYLLGKMDAVTEANGRTMLDNSLVAWTNELGKGNTHTRNNIPWVLAGSAGGAVQTGRSLAYPGVAHNNLLVTFCHAMGLRDEKTFGDPAFCTGPLADLV